MSRGAKGQDPDPKSDAYSRVDYRRFVAWPERIRRESDFLLQQLRRATDRSVLDLGCGTGEHCRFLSEQGFRVSGLDRSESMIARAQSEPLPANLSFVLGEMQECDQVVEGTFGAAISLGNTLPHMGSVEEIQRSLAGLSRLMVDGGVFLFQILNYVPILSEEVRHLPLNFQPSEDGEIVFLRLMVPLEGGRVRFCPSTLRLDPERDPPLEVLRSRSVELRGWTRADLLPLLKGAGFEVIGVHGDMSGGDYDPQKSADLVVVAIRNRSLE